MKRTPIPKTNLVPRIVGNHAIMIPPHAGRLLNTHKTPNKFFTIYLFSQVVAIEWYDYTGTPYVKFSLYEEEHSVPTIVSSMIKEVFMDHMREETYYAQQALNLGGQK